LKNKTDDLAGFNLFIKSHLTKCKQKIRSSDSLTSEIGENQTNTKMNIKRKTPHFMLHLIKAKKWIRVATTRIQINIYTLGKHPNTSLIF